MYYPWAIIYFYLVKLCTLADDFVSRINISQLKADVD